MPATIVVIFVLLFIAIIAWGYYAAQQRRKALSAWATGRGLSFSSDKVYGLDDRFDEFDCLRQGDNRYAYNVMEGAWSARPVMAFDYHYETHSTDSKGNRQTHHYHFSAVILESAVPLRLLFIRPEGLLDKITEFFGYDDIDFESAEFSRKFYVKSPDRKWAYDVIHQRTMEFLLAQPRFTLKFAPRHVIAYRSSVFECPDFEAAAGTAAGILDRLPQYLVQQQETSS